jgi:4-aminobutyrate aminotransferase-like enzyme
MEALKEAGAAVVIDEIQTFGRTTELFAFQHFGLDAFADVVTIGKLSQVCATLYRGDFKPAPGLISQTFTASTSAIHAASFIVGSLLGGRYFGREGRISRLHAHFEKRLAAIAGRHGDRLEGPFGIGAMVAFTVFGGDPGRTKAFLHALFEAGVIGFYAGAHPARVRFLLPIGAVTFEEIDEVSAMIEKVLAEDAAAAA